MPLTLEELVNVENWHMYVVNFIKVREVYISHCNYLYDNIPMSESLLSFISKCAAVLVLLCMNYDVCDKAVGNAVQCSVKEPRGLHSTRRRCIADTAPPATRCSQSQG